MIPGAAEVIAKLQKLRKRELKKVIRTAARPAAKAIQPEAVQEAPARSGVLRVSIKVRALKRSRKYSGAQVTIAVADTKAYYAGFVQLGTKKQKRNDFIKRATERNRAGAMRVFIDGIAEGINNVT